MIGLAAISIKIIIKNGKDMKRELWGVSVQPIVNKPRNQNAIQIPEVEKTPISTPLEDGYTY